MLHACRHSTSPPLIQLQNQRGLEWVGYVARVAEKRNTKRRCVNLKETVHLENLINKSIIILRWSLRKYNEWTRIELIWLMMGISGGLFWTR